MPIVEVVIDCAPALAATSRRAFGSVTPALAWPSESSTIVAPAGPHAAAGLLQAAQVAAGQVGRCRRVDRRR